MRTRRLILALAAMSVASCSSGSEVSGSNADASTPDAAVEVSALGDFEDGTNVDVTGYVVWATSGARLCEVLAESFPPQCGGASVDIVNPEALVVDFEQEGSVSWTNERVTVAATVDESGLIADGG